MYRSNLNEDETFDPVPKRIRLDQPEEKKWERDRVYKVIDAERDFQDRLNQDWSHAGCPSVEAEILMAERYLHLAREKWTTTFGGDPSQQVLNPGDVPALHELRKVVAMLIRCFENHGVPSRSS